jgi:TonB-dependent SusC/RagA subfamily outer membrane receptor
MHSTWIPTARWLLPGSLCLFFLGLTLSFSPTPELKQQILQGVENFNKRRIIEKVHLHLDKYLYTTGETVWFKAYVVEGISHKLFALSKVLHVELIGPEKDVLRRYKLPLLNGTANGDVILADSLTQGSYIIRGYTNNMRNEPGQFLFTRVIQVMSRDSNSVIKKTPAVVDPGIKVKFLPEGGYLVSGLDNKVGFKITDYRGMGVDGEVYIFTEAGNKVLETTSTHLGMGSFIFQPERDTRYFSKVITSKGTIESLAFTDIQQSGLRMIVNSLPKNHFGINLKDNSNLKKVLLVGLSRNTVRYMADVSLNKGVINLTIPKIPFLDGIVQFTVFSEDGLPLAERIVFKYPGQTYNLKAVTDKKFYRKRDKITLKLLANKKEEDLVAGSFSVSVTDQAQNFKDPQDGNIQTNLLMTSDLRGVIEQPAYYFSTPTLKILQDLDLLMLIQGWRRFKWEKVLTSDFAEAKYRFEQGISLKGRVRKNQRNKTIDAGKILMISVSQNPQYVESDLDSTGHFDLYPLDIFEYEDLVLQAENKRGRNNVEVDLIPEEFPEVGALVYHEFPPPEEVGYRLKEANKRSAIDKAYNFTGSVTYLESIVVTGKRVEQGPVKMYQRADVTLKTSDLPNAHTYWNVFQLMQSRVPGVRITGNTLTNPRVLIRGARSMSNSSEPLFLIDQFPVDKQAVLSIPVNDVESIDILKGVSAAIFGSRAANGAIAINLKRGEDREFERPPGVVNLNKIGYYPVREFQSPDYSIQREEHVKPDFRTTLYWNPEVYLDSLGMATISFYNADYLTSYLVRVEGISLDGVPMVAETAFESGQ